MTGTQTPGSAYASADAAGWAVHDGHADAGSANASSDAANGPAAHDRHADAGAADASAYAADGSDHDRAADAGSADASAYSSRSHAGRYTRSAFYDAARIAGHGI